MRLGSLLIPITVFACTSSVREDSFESSIDVREGCREQTLAWGSGVGLRPAALDSRAWGPQSIAIAPNGSALLLDAVNQRVLRLANGDVRVVATNIARDAEDIAIGADGAFAVWSPLQAKAWMFESSGEAIGEVSIDRAFRHVTGVAMTTSRRLAIRTAYQETFVVGSPAAPVDLATSLTAKREGAFLLADGRGVVVRAKDGAAELRVMDETPGRRATVRAMHSIPGRVDAAMLVGASGTTACMRVEKLEGETAVAVSRRAVCIDVETGRIALDVALPQPGIYLPRQELALGGGKLVALHAATDGLVVRTCEVAR
jgi:hypothetical protein